MVDDPRLRVVRPAPRPDVRHALVCFSYAGGGTAAFRPWAQVLPPGVELAIVCYPGREGRFGVPFARTWDELMSDVMAALLPLTSRRYVLFGHSFGARVAFDATARLAALGAPRPEAVVASASVAPVDHHVEWGQTPSPDDPDDALLTWMRQVGQVSETVLAEPYLRGMAIDLLRADFRVSRSYRYRPGTTVDVPVQVLHGADDDTVGAAAAHRWRVLTSAGCDVEELAGGHFYTDDIWNRLPDRIAALSPLRRSAPV